MVTAQLLRTAASDGCRSSARDPTNVWGRFPVLTTNTTNPESPSAADSPSAFVPFVLFVVERIGAHGSWHVHPVYPVFPLPLGRRDARDGLGRQQAAHNPTAESKSPNPLEFVRGWFLVSTTNHTNNESPSAADSPSAFVPFVLFVVERIWAHGSWHVHPVYPVFPLPLGRRDARDGLGMQQAAHSPTAEAKSPDPLEFSAPFCRPGYGCAYARRDVWPSSLHQPGELGTSTPTSFACAARPHTRIHQGKSRQMFEVVDITRH